MTCCFDPNCPYSILGRHIFISPNSKVDLGMDNNKLYFIKIGWALLVHNFKSKSRGEVNNE